MVSRTQKFAMPLAPVETLMKKTSGKRVSANAVKKLTKYLIASAKKITQKATIFAKHAGRSTIKEEDIELAIKEDL